MKLKFKFSKPLEVSNGAEKNSITFRIKEGSYFVSSRSKLSIQDQESPVKVKYLIPIQLPSGVEQYKLEETAALQENTLKLLLVLQIVGAVFLNGSKDKLISLISVLQIIVYMPIY